jgi:2-phospho-L-lactate/phosphoenolpyruvate guanylyltransferase
MFPVIVPFRSGGKTRLPAEIRGEIALAMLGDVLEAAVAYGPTRLVTDDPSGAFVAVGVGAVVIDDPGGGQGAAVRAGLAGIDGPCLVLNADVPCARPSDLGALAVAAQAGALGLVTASDGTTNALALPWPEVFQPLYGPGSAGHFRAHAQALGLVWQDLALPNLRADVDTAADLEQIGRRAGARTRALLRAIEAA